MKAVLGLIAASLASLTGSAGAVAGGSSRLHPLTPQGTHMRAAGYDLDLGDGDPADRPTAWSGPVKVSGGSSPCTVSDDVAVVTTPLAWTAGRFAYLNTYSGSYGRVYAVDLRDCAVRWTSPRFIGVAHFDATGIVLPGGRRVRVSATGLPAKR